MTYQLPTDVDGVKYHGREYDDKGGIIAAGVDEHGNDKPILINTDGSLNMQSVVQELHDIKQRQQEILERLDDPIDTRVTGSIVELASGFNDITISAGSSIDLLSGINLIEQGFTKIRVVVRTGGTELTLQQRWRVGATALRLSDNKLTTGQYSNEFDFNVLSNNLTLSVLNSSSNVDDGVIIRAIVLGVK